MIDLNAIPFDDEGFVELELTLNLKYEGTEIADQFTASGGTGVTPDAEFWSIEFLNVSDGEDEIWTDVMDVSMGVGIDNNDTDQVLETNVTVKIVLPLQNQSVTLDDGHAVNMRFTSDGGLSEASVRVFIPQQYNISLNDAPEAIGIGDGGETLVTLSVVNNGNGDDTISVQSSLEQSCIDAGWQVTGSTNLTVAANDERAQSFTIFSAQNSTVDKCDIEFTAESEGDFEIQTAETEARISVVRLVIEESLVEPGGADAEANADGIFRIPISNVGFLTAAEVKVTLEADEFGNTVYEPQQDTHMIPAEEVRYFEFPYSGMPPGDARLRVSVEVMDPANEDSVADDSADEAILTIPFSNMASEDGESPFLVIVIVALTLLVLYGGYNTARKGSSGRF